MPEGDTYFKDRQEGFEAGRADERARIRAIIDGMISDGPTPMQLGTLCRLKAAIEGGQSDA